MYESWLILQILCKSFPFDFPKDFPQSFPMMKGLSKEVG